MKFKSKKVFRIIWTILIILVGLSTILWSAGLNLYQ